MLGETLEAVREETVELTTLPPQKPPHTFQRVRNTSLEFLQHSGAIAASDLRWAPDGGIVDGGRAAAGRSPCLYTGVTVFERTRQLILDVRGL